MNSSQQHIAAFFDLDGTLYDGILYQGVFRHHREHGLKRGAMIGFMAFHLPFWLLTEARLFPRELFYRMHGANLAWLLGGISLERAEAMWEWIIETTIMPSLRPEMMAAIERHRKEKHRLILLSGSFVPLLERLVARLGFEGAIATPLQIRNGRYLGRIERPTAIGRGKLKRLRDFLRGDGKDIDLDRSYYYADSIADVPCMEVVGNPIAVYPEKGLAGVASDSGWEVIGAG
jgi:HAD superfamily hydrolase (TIGR01490 family)